MRKLREQVADPGARLAIDIFCLSAAKQIAALATALGGLDLLVFTGGIGEHDDETRREICAGLAWLGVGSEAAAVRTLPAKEEEQIARHTAALAGSVSDALNAHEGGPQSGKL
jgi:acetate kinase